jgi:electron transport complex protein RnfE
MARSCWYEFRKGIWGKHPVFCLLLGLCTTLAVSIRVENAVAMGIATICILSAANTVISLLRKAIPHTVHLPVFLVVIATFVTLVEVFLKGFLPDIHKALGIYLPLIVVNCIVLARAEAHASKHGPLSAFLDGAGMGTGYAIGIVLIAVIRETWGTGMIVIRGVTLLRVGILPAEIMVLPPGGFLVMGLLLALFAFLERRMR